VISYFILGIALESFGFEKNDQNSNIETGKVLTFVNLSYWMPSISDLAANDRPLDNIASGSEQTNLNGLFGFILNQFKKIGVVFEKGVVRAANVIADKITAKQIKTEELCVDDICVTREKFKQVFGESEPESEPVNTPAPSESSAPSPESEPSLESTPEPTPTPIESLTPEPTPFASPESTPESTPQSTPKATLEPTLEPTPEASSSEAPTAE